MSLSNLKSPLSNSLTLAALLALTLPALAQTEPGNFDHPRPTRHYKSHSPRDDQGHWTPTDFAAANPKLPTLFIAGDSTAAPGDPDHRGWGAVLADFFDASKVNLINRAVGGRSFRTFYAEGKWQQIVDHLKPGDYVIIEFGHNDGGGPNASTGRGDVPGIGDDTAQVTKRDGTTETVHSFGWYLRTFIHDVQQKHATPIVSTPTIRNIWTDGHVESHMGKISDWDQQVAAAEKAPLIDHGAITANLYDKMGQPAVAPLFPADHTHTSTEGALLNAQTLIAGLKSLPNMPLADDLNAQGNAIPPATPTNATAP